MNTETHIAIIYHVRTFTVDLQYTTSIYVKCLDLLDWYYLNKQNRTEQMVILKLGIYSSWS